MDEQMRKQARKNKVNMRIFPIYRMLSIDFLFYYGIEFLFLSQIKNLSTSQIVFAAAFYGIFKIIFQFVATILIDFLKQRRSIILGNACNLISMFLFMWCPNIIVLILSYAISSLGFSLKETAEPQLLQESVPDSKKKGEIFAKIDGKGSGNYYYISAVTSIAAGFLFNVNGYIPVIVCTVITAISTIMSLGFQEIEDKQIKTGKDKVWSEINNYKLELKESFKLVFESRRLKAIILYSVVFIGLLDIMGAYQMDLLSEMNISAGAIGIIYAAMELICGIASRNQEKLHRKFRNKLLTIVGISYTISIFIAGIFAMMSIPFAIAIFVILITYSFRAADCGLFYVIIRRYLGNFADEELLNTIYSSYGIADGLGRGALGIIASIVVDKAGVKLSMVILGIVFTFVILAILNYMKTRVGLRPEQYTKKDIPKKKKEEIKV